MDTKFKNHDLLIKALDECIKYRYNISEMIQIKNMIINDDTTFEHAACAVYPLSHKYAYHIISKIYHIYITQHNDRIRKNKQKE